MPFIVSQLPFPSMASYWLSTPTGTVPRDARTRRVRVAVRARTRSWTVARRRRMGREGKCISYWPNYNRSVQPNSPPRPPPQVQVQIQAEQSPPYQSPPRYMPCHAVGSVARASSFMFPDHSFRLAPAANAKAFCSPNLANGDVLEQSIKDL